MSAYATQSKVRSLVEDTISISSLSDDTPLMDAGMDSISAIEVRNTLSVNFHGAVLPAVTVFDFPSV